MQNQYWSEVEDFLRSRVRQGDQIVAPRELMQKFPNTRIYSATHHESPAAFDWIVIHKSRISSINCRFLLQALENFEPVFADPVFVILSQVQIADAVEFEPVHLEALLEQVTQLEANSIQTRLLRKLRQFKILPQTDVAKKLALIQERLRNLEAKMQRSIDLQRGGKSIALLSKEELIRASRAACQSTYIGHDTLLCRVLGKYLIYIDSKDLGIAPHLCMNGYWEPHVTQSLARAIQPGWCCIDVGANYGYFSLLMSEIVGSTGRVAALEPNPNLIALINQTFIVNGFAATRIANGLKSRVEIIDRAVSNKAGETVTLSIPIEGNLGGASIMANAISAGNTFEVETITIDQLTHDWERVDLIKIDAEGAEQLIWEGMQDTIRKHHDITIVMEFSAIHYAEPRRFLESVQQAGFLLKRILKASGALVDCSIEECLSETTKVHWELFLTRPAA
ncbi:FkbM family methyltransferase [Phormidium tenue FACHB-886]|nr:FkbM family methyltransferase [Phormidium tenue FACHB-886]